MPSARDHGQSSSLSQCTTHASVQQFVANPGAAYDGNHQPRAHMHGAAIPDELLGIREDLAEQRRLIHGVSQEVRAGVQAELANFLVSLQRQYQLVPLGVAPVPQEEAEGAGSAELIAENDALQARLREKEDECSALRLRLFAMEGEGADSDAPLMVEPFEEEEDEGVRRAVESNAAMTVQSMHRGRAARAQHNNLSRQRRILSPAVEDASIAADSLPSRAAWGEDVAAARVQAHVRGRAARNGSRPALSQSYDEDDSHPEAVRNMGSQQTMQALLTVDEEEAAAAHLQARVRGNAVRSPKRATLVGRRAESLPEELLYCEEEEDAVVLLQARKYALLLPAR